ncbi:MAG: hypothetical protein ACFB9M_11435 [Myxococcota bacterium]
MSVSFVPPSQTRLTAHWAANVPASVAAAVVKPKPDYDHTALRWHPLWDLASAPLSPQEHRVGLDLVTGQTWVARGEVRLVSMELAGKTLRLALDELGEALAAQGGPRGAVELLDLSRPHHPVATGGTFGPWDTKQHASLRSWFAFAADVLERERSEHPDASALRCWPHHFDLAALWKLDDQDEPEDARSVGIGFSPGDEAYEEPYFYVLPWPPPAPEKLPSLDSGWGGWHTTGFVAAVLTATQLAERLTEASDRADAVSEFLAEATEAATRVLSN